MQLSAAVGPTPQDARQRHFQDSSRWIREGLLDAVYPMNYAADQAMYNTRLADWTSARLPIPVVPGIMFDRRDPATVLPQMDRAIGTASHFAAFAYNSLFERRNASGRVQADAASAGRATLRRQVIPRIQQLGRNTLITAGR